MELTEDMVNSCVPGDIVTIVGVVKVCLRFFGLARHVFERVFDLDPHFATDGDQQ